MLTLLDPDNPIQAFPPIQQALVEPDGLLAIGGCLSCQRLLNAYRNGIFPWFSSGEPILWWSPNPRLVLFPDNLKISHSLLKTIRKGVFSVSFDTAFANVINACAEPRDDHMGTWITAEMKDAYNELHRSGFAHSIEVWLENKLVGGLYGIAIGQVFFGESMFHSKTDASKIAFVFLIESLHEWGYQLIDCQVHTHHLISLGAEEICRNKFQELLQIFCNTQPRPHAWKS